MDATNFVKTIETHQHRKIACLEEIAYLNGWITRDQLCEIAKGYGKSLYGEHLKKVAGEAREDK